jgi:hypothetical protein
MAVLLLIAPVIADAPVTIMRRKTSEHKPNNFFMSYILLIILIAQGLCPCFYPTSSWSLDFQRNMMSSH